jgi:hypothetical protein
MRSGPVEIVGIDRSRSGISYGTSGPATLWTVAFVLKPSPTRSWRGLFDELSTPAACDSGLGFSLDSRSEQPSYYGRLKPGLWAHLQRSIRRWIRRRRGAVLRVRCPASENHVERAFIEAQRLVDTINTANEQNATQRIERESTQAEALAQLSHSIDIIERTRIHRDQQRNRNRSLRQESTGQGVAEAKRDGADSLPVKLVLERDSIPAQGLQVPIPG